MFFELKIKIIIVNVYNTANSVFNNKVPTIFDFGCFIRILYPLCILELNHCLMSVRVIFVAIAIGIKLYREHWLMD